VANGNIARASDAALHGGRGHAPIGAFIVSYKQRHFRRHKGAAGISIFFCRQRTWTSWDVPFTSRGMATYAVHLPTGHALLNANRHGAGGEDA